MTASFYTAGTATVQTQKGMDIIANNVANVSTTGYKSQRAAFADLLYTSINGSEGDIAAGNGAKLSRTDTLFDMGTLYPTGRVLDFAAEDENAFFAISTDSGIRYTRDGSFSLSKQADGTFCLANSQGCCVLDKNGSKITVDANDIENSKIDIGAFYFDNPDGLMRAGENCFTATTASGEAVAIDNAVMRQGFLEASGVDLAEQMSQMIQTQRAFQFNARMVTISDELMQTVNNMR